MPRSRILIIRPPLLPAVANPPSKVARRMSWKPRKVSAVISWTTAIAIQPAISPVSATRAGEFRRLPTKSPTKR